MAFLPRLWVSSPPLADPEATVLLLDRVVKLHTDTSSVALPLDLPLDPSSWLTLAQDVILSTRFPAAAAAGPSTGPSTAATGPALMDTDL